MPRHRQFRKIYRRTVNDGELINFC